MSRDDAAPYAANSQSIDGSMAVGGIPVNRLDRSGVIIPAIKPYGNPQTMPHKRIGMCIGRNTRPALGTE